MFASKYDIGGERRGWVSCCALAVSERGILHLKEPEGLLSSGMERPQPPHWQANTRCSAGRTVRCLSSSLCPSLCLSACAQWNGVVLGDGCRYLRVPVPACCEGCVRRRLKVRSLAVFRMEKAGEIEFRRVFLLLWPSAMLVCVKLTR